MKKGTSRERINNFVANINYKVEDKTIVLQAEVSDHYTIILPPKSDLNTNIETADKNFAMAHYYTNHSKLK